MEKIITIKSSQIMQGAKGEYLRVTDTEDKGQNIFDPDLWPVFNDGASVKLTLEKEGKWWNVKGAEHADAPVPKTTPKQAASGSKPAPQLDDRARSMSLSYAKDMAVAEIKVGKFKGMYESVFMRAEILLKWMQGEFSVPAEVVLAKIVEMTSTSKEIQKGGEKP